jgi:hypothetical protein
MHALILIVSYTAFVAAPLAMLHATRVENGELDQHKPSSKGSWGAYRLAATAVGMLVTVVISYIG